MDIRDPHGYDAYKDPPIAMPRRLAVAILENLEMWFDVVKSQTGKQDHHLLQVIADLTHLLEASD